MPTLREPFHAGVAESLADAFKALLDETLVLIEALLSPNRIIGEVEQMRALQVAADDIEPTDPARAELLRSRASRIGLR
ncbi:hypothetical protein [Variovorax beijingensis]|uniref:hypothetical protein n=1 Tax=Variovorax beijingensis TaxID=2496117 RepID=UPI003F69E417